MLFLVSLGLTVAVYRAVPTGFVPDEDQNLVIMQLQAPEGASLDYSSSIGQQVEAVLQKEPAIRAVFSVMGFSFGGASPNRGMLFVRLLPIEQRLTPELGAPAVVGRLRGGPRQDPRSAGRAVPAARAGAAWARSAASSSSCWTRAAATSATSRKRRET